MAALGPGNTDGTARRPVGSRCFGSGAVLSAACMAAVAMVASSCGDEFSGTGGSGGSAGSSASSTSTSQPTSTTTSSTTTSTTDSTSSSTTTTSSSCAFDGCSVQPPPEQRGCNECVESVCAEYPDCCTEHWSDACVRDANFFCDAACGLECRDLLPSGLTFCPSSSDRCWVETADSGTCALLCRAAGLECEAAWYVGSNSPTCDGGVAMGCEDEPPSGAVYRLRCSCLTSCGAQPPCPPLWPCGGEPIACQGPDG